MAYDNFYAKFNYYLLLVKNMRIEFTRDEVDALHKKEMTEKTQIREELIQLNLDSADELQNLSWTISGLSSLSQCINEIKSSHSNKTLEEIIALSMLTGENFVKNESNTHY
jgi:hypothetical protein